MFNDWSEDERSRYASNRILGEGRLDDLILSWRPTYLQKTETIHAYKDTMNFRENTRILLFYENFCCFYRIRESKSE